MSDENKQRGSERKVATALKYDTQTDGAPKVIAKGMGIVAENILKKAEESDIPVYQNETLANQLYHLSLGQEIPPELYNVVAEVMIFIARMDSNAGRSKK